MFAPRHARERRDGLGAAAGRRAAPGTGPSHRHPAGSIVLNHDTLYQTLTEIFRDVFDDPALVATPELSAADVAEWASFTPINLIVAAARPSAWKFPPPQTQ